MPFSHTLVISLLFAFSFQLAHLIFILALVNMLLFLEGSFLVANDFMIYMFLRVSFYLWLFSSFLWVYLYCFSVYIFIWVSLNIFFVYICFTLLHPITCPIPLSSNALQSRRCFGFDTSWCVSCLDSGAKTVPDCCGISLTSVSFCCCYFTCSWTGSSMGLAACCMFVTCLGTPFFCSNKYSFLLFKGYCTPWLW